MLQVYAPERQHIDGFILRCGTDLNPPATPCRQYSVYQFAELPIINGSLSYLFGEKSRSN